MHLIYIVTYKHYDLSAIKGQILILQDLIISRLGFLEKIPL